MEDRKLARPTHEEKNSHDLNQRIKIGRGRRQDKDEEKE
jgi:hypothetical protein